MIINLSGLDFAIFKYPFLTLLKNLSPEDSILSLVSLVFLDKPIFTGISNRMLLCGTGHFVNDINSFIKDNDKFLPYPWYAIDAS